MRMHSALLLLYQVTKVEEEEEAFVFLSMSVLALTEASNWELFIITLTIT